MKADFPDNEAERLQALRRYDILDTPPDNAFDRIVQLAARLLATPIAIVSLVDADRIWFKSRHGIEASQVTRDAGLCASAILFNQPWIVTDASLDPRALANPLVATEHGFRFYAAAPLITHDGYNLGTLCVIDFNPRLISADEIATLQDLAGLVMEAMELRLNSRNAVAAQVMIHQQERDLIAAYAALQSESQRRFALDAAQIGDWDFDFATNIGRWSAIHAECFGHAASPPGWNFDAVLEQVHVDDRARVRKSFEEARASMGVIEVEFRVLWPDTSVHWLWWKGHFFRDALSDHLHVAGVVREVTATRCAEEKMHQLALIMEMITTPVMVTGAAGDISWCNRPFEVLSGYRLDEIAGRRPGSFLQGPETDPATVRKMHDALIQAQSFEVEIQNHHRSGRTFWQHLKVDPVFGDDGTLSSFIAVQSDITERKQFESLMWRNANFDLLSGLPNRRLFWDRLENEIRHAARGRKLAGLFYVDLDRFKEVNDLFGHEAGDRLLRTVGQRIQSCVRKSDTVARIGGDEFTVILSELDSTAYAERVARQVIVALSQPFDIDNARVSLSASVGIAVYPGDGVSAPELFKNADLAMYRAKSGGKNQFSYFTRSMQEQSTLRLRTGVDLRLALRRGEMTVLFQPIISLASGRIVKAEALLRWRHPSRGMVEPSEFIPLAEELGLIQEMGEWVFHEAALWAEKFSRHTAQPFQISVNKSPMQFGARPPVTSWPEQLKAMQLPCRSISVEITEGVLLQDSRFVIDTLHEYRRAGIEVALDDFGTGYSSMSYLVKFGIDYLKIDQSFVRDMALDVSRTIAETIIVMGHKLGMQIIAEGIETADQQRLLTEAGCDFGQGYLFAHPMLPADLERMLIERREFPVAANAGI